MTTLDEILKAAAELEQARKYASAKKWVEKRIEGNFEAIAITSGDEILARVYENANNSKFICESANSTSFLCDAIKHLVERVQRAEEALDLYKSSEKISVTVWADETKDGRCWLEPAIEHGLVENAPDCSNTEFGITAEEALTANREAEEEFQKKWSGK